MAGKSKKREKIKLKSTAENSPTYYTTMKNKQNTPGKLRIKKYDPFIGKHVEFVEDKIK